MLFDDLSIQKSIQAGNVAEFERLFHRFYQPLCLFAGKILHDRTAAEDIVQEIFYNFWKNRQSQGLKLSIKAYLYSAVRNNAVHYLEHMEIRARYADTVKSGYRQQLLAETDHVGYKELTQAVQQTLRLLPERSRQIFRLNRFEGKKYLEIAEILSISVKTVESDMGKALRLFRQSLKEFTNQES